MFCNIWTINWYGGTAKDVPLKKHTGSGTVLTGAADDSQTVKFMSNVVTPFNRNRKYWEEKVTAITVQTEKESKKSPKSK